MHDLARELTFCEHQIRIAADGISEAVSKMIHAEYNAAQARVGETLSTILNAKEKE